MHLLISYFTGIIVFCFGSVNGVNEKYLILLACLIIVLGSIAGEIGMAFCYKRNKIKEIIQFEQELKKWKKEIGEYPEDSSKTDLMSRKEFILDEMHEAQSFDMTQEQISLYFERISQYIEEHGYYAHRHVKLKHPIEPLSERQMICSQNAINCLFKQEFVQALHETLDVLSDYGKEIRLNYNEYVVLKNIITTYNNISETQCEARE